MGALRTAQNSFAGGEFSPALWGRFDLQKFGTGLRTGKNFIVHSDGSASNRPGTRFVAKAKAGATNVRLIPFRRSASENYIIEIGSYMNGLNPITYMRFFTVNGAVKVSSPAAWVTTTVYVAGLDYVTHSGVIYHCLVTHTSGTFATDLAAGKWEASDIYELTITGSFNADIAAADIATLKYAQSADTMFITTSTKTPLILRHYSDTLWTITAYPSATGLTDGPFMLENTNPFVSTDVVNNKFQVAATTGSGVNISLSSGSYPFFTSSFLGRLMRLTHHVGATTARNSYTSGVALPQHGTAVSCMGAWRLRTHGTWSGAVDLEISIDGGASYRKIRSYQSVDDFNADTFGVEDNPDQTPFLIRATVTALTSGTISLEVSNDSFYQEGIIRITSITNDHVAVGTVVKAFADTTATDEWAIGSWGPDSYPRTVAFFQDRLCFGGSAYEPETLWMTKSSDYYSFARSSPLVDSDAITVNLPSRQVNEIRDLAPATRLLVLTAGSPYTVRTGSDGIFSPTSIIIEAAGNTGCASVGAAIINDRVIFVQPLGSRVRDMAYDFQAGGFVPTNLSVISSHLLRGFSILSLAYQQEPDSILWFVRSDGKLLSLTYDKEQEMLAWTQHDTNSGYPGSTQGAAFTSCATIPNGTFDELWVTAVRGATMIERLSNRILGDDIRQSVFLDSSLTYDHASVLAGVSQANPAVASVLAAESYAVNDIVNLTIFDLNVSATAINRSHAMNGNFKVSAVGSSGGFTLLTLADAITGDPIDATGFVTGIGQCRKLVSSVSGLDHLEGRTDVYALADGYPMGPFTVSGGSITISRPSGIVQAGLGYVARLSTLNFEVQRRDGPMMGATARVAAVTLRLDQSAGGKVGPDESTLTPIPYPATTRPDYFSGDAYTRLNSKTVTDPRIVLVQDQPLPMTVLAITPALELGRGK